MGDKDENGSLSIPEVTELLKELGVNGETAEEAAVMLDISGDGRIEYTEFVSGCINYFQDKLKDHLWQAFTQYDIDGNGTLSRDEVAKILSGGDLPPGVTPEDLDVDAVMEQFRIEDVQTLTFNDFVSLFA